MKTIGVLGAGTWGIALAGMLSSNGHNVIVWSALTEEIDNLLITHRHPNLPGAVVPDEIVFTKDISDACKNVDVLLFAVPSIFVRSTAARAREFVADGQVIVDVAKGIEPETLLTLTSVIREEIQKDGKHDGIKLVALSGPTHAEEVACNLPSTIVSSCADLKTAEFVQNVFMNDCMRVYTNTDVLGVELCGALKNIIALASGISTGLGYGDNAKAAIITRGLAEITRLGIAMGCSAQTFSGLAGVGDIIVTATSVHSRNNRAGCLIGQGYTPGNAVKEVGMVVEGINALPAAMELAQKYKVEMPIVNAINEVINNHVDPSKAVHVLMCRDKKTECYK